VQFAEYVRKHYQTIILIAVALGLARGVFTTLPGQALQTYSQALTFLMILFLSLTTTRRQFLLVAKQPGAVLALGLG
jgi:hypothetical protein